MYRFVAYSPAIGIYLGETPLGMALFSGWDPGGRREAPTFSSFGEWKSIRERFTNECTLPGDIRLVQVYCHGNDPYFATIEDCANANLPRWNPLQVPPPRQEKSL